jgi:hypothetical protein
MRFICTLIYFLVVLGVELRTFCFLGRYTATLTILPACTLSKFENNLCVQIIIQVCNYFQALPNKN